MILDKAMLRNALVEHVLDACGHKASRDGWKDVLVWNGRLTLAHTMGSRWHLAWKLWCLIFVVLTKR